MRIKRLAIVAVLLGLFAASLVASQNPATPAQIAVPDGYPAVGQPPIVTLLAPGAEPRTAMRYKMPNNLKVVGDMTMAVKMGMEMAGLSMPAVEAPPIKMAMTVDVKDVSPAGDVTYDFGFSDVAVDKSQGTDPALIAAMEEGLGAMKDFRGTAVVTSRGATKTLTADLSKMDASLQKSMGGMFDSMQSMTPPFPEEAVGVGARWDVRQSMNSGGVRMFQKAIFEVLAIDREGATFQIKFEQTAPAQALNDPSVSGSLQSLVGSGTGTSKIRFDSPIPTSDATVTTTMVMEIGAGGDASRMTMSMTMKLAIAPRKQ